MAIITLTSKFKWRILSKKNEIRIRSECEMRKKATQSEEEEVKEEETELERKMYYLIAMWTGNTFTFTFKKLTHAANLNSDWVARTNAKSEFELPIVKLCKSESDIDEFERKETEKKNIAGQQKKKLFYARFFSIRLILFFFLYFASSYAKC